jgi:hypothetical protein
MSMSYDDDEYTLSDWEDDAIRHMESLEIDDGDFDADDDDDQDEDQDVDDDDAFYREYYYDDDYDDGWYCDEE